MTATKSRFGPGTFAPAPQAATAPAMLLAQSWLELKLLLRNGEQLLLTMFIPIAMLVGLALLPLPGDATGSVADAVAAVMMVAVMSTAFTGQAIATGFDRRYGALKRLGATPLPRWGIVAGKSTAVLIVVVLQAVVLGAIGVVLGWRPSLAGLLLGAVVIALGTITFAALGLLLGGTLRADIVLALANIIWFLLLGVATLVFATVRVPAAAQVAARLTPSGALASALRAATGLSADWLALAALAVWGAAAAILAIRYFRFT